MKISSYISWASAIFGLTLCGYGIVSFLATDADSSRLVTVPFRLAITSLNVVFLIYNLRIFRGFLKPKTLIRAQSSNLQLNTFSSLWRNWLNRLVLIFILLYSYRLINDTVIVNDPALSREPTEYLLFWFLIILIPSFNFLFLDKLKPDKYLLLTWFFHCPIIISSFFIDFTQSRVFQEQGRVAGTALNSISLGHYAASLALVSIYALLKGTHDSRWLNATYVITSCMGISMLFLASSRSPIIAFLVCLFLILLSSRRVNFKFIALFFVLGVSLLIGYSFASSIGSSFLDRFLNISDEVDSNDLGGSITRTGLYHLTWDLFAQNPLTGFGIEIPNEGYPHNIVFEAFLALGVFGGLIFLVILLCSAFRALQLIFSKEGRWGWIGILYVQYIILGMFSGAIHGSILFWYFMFSVLGIRLKDLKLSKKLV